MIYNKTIIVYWYVNTYYFFVCLKLFSKSQKELTMRGLRTHPLVQQSAELRCLWIFDELSDLLFINIVKCWAQTSLDKSKIFYFDK